MEELHPLDRMARNVRHLLIMVTLNLFLVGVLLGLVIARQ